LLQTSFEAPFFRTLQKDLTSKLEVCLKAMENNHEDIVEAIEELKKNQKEMTSMMQEMYFMMKEKLGGHGNQYGLECPKGIDVAKSIDGDIKVVRRN
jgi:hypothetical protein